MAPNFPEVCPTSVSASCAFVCRWDGANDACSAEHGSSYERIALDAHFPRMKSTHPLSLSYCSSMPLPVLHTAFSETFTQMPHSFCSKIVGCEETPMADLFSSAPSPSFSCSSSQSQTYIIRKHKPRSETSTVETNGKTVFWIQHRLCLRIAAYFLSRKKGSSSYVFPLF